MLAGKIPNGVVLKARPPESWPLRSSPTHRQISITKSASRQGQRYAGLQIIIKAPVHQKRANLRVQYLPGYVADGGELALGLDALVLPWLV